MSYASPSETPTTITVDTEIAIAIGLVTATSPDVDMDNNIHPLGDPFMGNSTKKRRISSTETSQESKKARLELDVAEAPAELINASTSSTSALSPNQIREPVPNPDNLDSQPVGDERRPLAEPEPRKKYFSGLG